ncbi:MAG: hypothetical protein WBW49_26530, partial [Candidatus Acidiferrum sp.]
MIGFELSRPLLLDRTGSPVQRCSTLNWTMDLSIWISKEKENCVRFQGFDKAKFKTAKEATTAVSARSTS